MPAIHAEYTRLVDRSIGQPVQKLERNRPKLASIDPPQMVLAALLGWRTAYARGDREGVKARVGGDVCLLNRTYVREVGSGGGGSGFTVRRSGGGRRASASASMCEGPSEPRKC
jgi:hypothetical protein